MKPISDARTCKDGCTYLRRRLHVLAGTDARTCGDGCTYLRGRLHVLAETVALYLRGQMLNEAFPANGCGDGCTYLRERLQCFASERGKTGAEIVSPILDERKGGSIRVTIVPQKNSTEWTKTKITPWR